LKKIIFATLLSGCATKPVTLLDWSICNTMCRMEMSQLIEVCHHPWKGLGCKCIDDSILWFEENTEEISI
jgi:hypothetical protein